MATVEHEDNCPQNPQLEELYPTLVPMRDAAYGRSRGLIAGRVHEPIFFPWAGKRYASRRLLVVGESHYHWCNPCIENKTPLRDDTTCHCIAHHLAEMSEKWAAGGRHWKTIENALIGEEASIEARKAFWHDIAYYNYLTESVGKGARVAVMKELWERAQSPFLSLLEALRPTHLVVVGRRVWQQMPAEGDENRMPSIPNGGRRMDRCRYVLPSDATVECLGVPHTAAGLGAPWHAGISKFIPSRAG